MRVILDPNGRNVPGTLTVDESEILHFLNGVKVQKFYQQMLVTFTPDIPGTWYGSKCCWAVSNWGPGVENSVVGDLKGGIKVVAYGSEIGARQANRQQVRTKMQKGYQPNSNYGSGCAEPPSKLLREIGAKQDVLGASHPARQAAPAKEFRVERPEKPTLPLPPSINVSNLQTGISELAKITLRALARDDIPSAITSRRSLIALIGEVNALQENAAGQLEILNAKLSEALR